MDSGCETFGGCQDCHDLSPIETELVAQARLITNAKYEFADAMFAAKLLDEGPPISWFGDTKGEVISLDPEKQIELLREFFDKPIVS